MKSVCLFSCYRISDRISASFPNYNSLTPSNPFNIFSLEFWQFIGSQSAQPAVTKRPPKKYSQQVSSTPANRFSFLRPQQQQQVKPSKPPRAAASRSSTTPRTKPATAAPAPIDGPIRIALPFQQLLQLPGERQKPPPRRSSPPKETATSTASAPRRPRPPPTAPAPAPAPLAATTVRTTTAYSPTSKLGLDKGKRQTAEAIREQHNCPRENEVRFQLFPKICKVDADCEGWQGGELCCEIFGTKSCANGVRKPLEESSHMRKYWMPWRPSQGP